MNFKIKTLIFALLIAMFSNTLLSNTLPSIDKNKLFEVRISYQRASAGKFHDYSGKAYLQDIDSLYSPQLDTLSKKTDSTELLLDTIGWDSRNYTFENNSHTIFAEVLYSPNSHFHFQATLPLSFYSFQERWGTVIMRNGSKYTVGGGEEKRKLTLTRLDYLRLQANSFLFNKKIILGLHTSINIPFGFTQSIALTKDYPLLSDGYFEAELGPILGYKSKKMRFITEAFYNYRDEEPLDNIFINALFGFSTVENTELSVFAQYAKSLGKYKPEYDFQLTREVIWQEYLDLGVEMKMRFTDNIYGYGGYKVRFYNKNTWNNGLFWFTAAYIF